MSIINTHRLSVNASTEHLAEVRDFVAEYAFECGFTDKQVQDIRLAVDEAYTNIIKHAYKFDSTRKVDIELGVEGENFYVSLFDEGISFDINSYKKPDLSEKLKQKKRGGFGVYLIKQLMDNVEYHTEGSQNEIKMVKKI